MSPSSRKSAAPASPAKSGRLTTYQKYNEAMIPVGPVRIKKAVHKELLRAAREINRPYSFIIRELLEAWTEARRKKQGGGGSSRGNSAN
jgi:hypothetical protein